MSDIRGNPALLCGYRGLQMSLFPIAVITIFWQHVQSVDKQIGDAAERWSFDRISSVERNTMRVAVTELTCLEVPPKVVLDEAIEIAREYGGQESPRFVNGVLDRIFQMLPEGEKGEG